MTHDVIIGCLGVGPITGTDTVDLKHYENGTVIYAVRPKDDIPPKRLARYKRRLDRLQYEMLEIIEDMTGGTIYEPEGEPHN